MTCRHLLAFVSVALVLAAPSACTTTTSAGPGTNGGTTDAGNGTGDGGNEDGGSASSEPLTCFGIFQCAADCSETDTGCEDACFARGTDEAKAATTDVVNCYQAHACEDGDCLQANCAAEINACAALQVPQGQAVDDVPPASAPPAELVGKWHSYYAPDAHTEDWTFNADGTAAHYSASVHSLASGCQWAGITDSTGTVVVEGDKLTYYQTAGTAQENNCGWKSNKAAPKNSYTYAWAIDETGKLLLIDQNLQSCIVNPGYASCRTTLDPQ